MLHSLCAFSKVLRPEKLAAHLFEVDEDVEKDEVSQLVKNKLTSKLSSPFTGIFTTKSGPIIGYRLPFSYRLVNFNGHTILTEYGQGWS